MPCDGHSGEKEGLKRHYWLIAMGFVWLQGSVGGARSARSELGKQAGLFYDLANDFGPFPEGNAYLNFCNNFIIYL